MSVDRVRRRTTPSSWQPGAQLRGDTTTRRGEARLWAWVRAHRRSVAAAALAVTIVACGIWIRYSFWWIRPVPSPVQLTVAGGCPANIAGHHGVRNSGRLLGPFFQMAPGSPDGGLICVYQSPPNAFPDQPPLLQQASLTAAQASRLVQVADQASTHRPLHGVVCSGGPLEDFVLALHYPGGGHI